MENNGKFIRSFDGTRIWYQFHKNTKECLVFLHGLPGSSSAWKFIYPSLFQQGYSTLLVDLRGHGFSEKPRETNRYSIYHIVEDVKQILDKEHIPQAILIGHCYGGLVAQQFYATYPEYTKKIVLINSDYSFSKQKARRFASRSLYYLCGICSFFVSPLSFETIHLHLDYDKFRGSGDFNLLRIYHDMRATSFKTFLPLYKELLSLDFTEELKNASVPFLILHGKHDWVVPMRKSVEMKRLIKNSSLAILNTNHISIINSPGEIIAMSREFI